jgi:hypothetical protein
LGWLAHVLSVEWRGILAPLRLWLSVQCYFDTLPSLEELFIKLLNHQGLLGPAPDTVADHEAGELRVMHQKTIRLLSRSVERF